MPVGTSSETSKTEKPFERALRELKELSPQVKADVRTGVKAHRTIGGLLVARFHYAAHPDRDPEINPEWKASERRKYTSQASWDRELEIVDEAGGGELVFADTLLTYRDKIIITDPRWRPDPEWDVDGGMDHGKTNATAVLRAYHDFAGTIYFCGEYYQPGREVWQHAPIIKKMADFSRVESFYADPTIFYSTLQQSQRPGQSAERAKSIGELYTEQGIENFISFGGDRSDVSFAARLQLHWADLEHREPTVKIVCRNEGEGPQFGLHNWDCPNLLWELMRARKQKLSALQLLSRNASEAIVDKDNHARDAMKYELMSHPEPTRKSMERRVNERVAELQKVDPTVAVAQYHKILAEEQEEEEPGYYGSGARRRFDQMKRRRGVGRR